MRPYFQVIGIVNVFVDRLRRWAWCRLSDVVRTWIFCFDVSVDFTVLFTSVVRMNWYLQCELSIKFFGAALRIAWCCATERSFHVFLRCDRFLSLMACLKLSVASLKLNLARKLLYLSMMCLLAILFLLGRQVTLLCCLKGNIFYCLLHDVLNVKSWHSDPQLLNQSSSCEVLIFIFYDAKLKERLEL